MGDESWHDEVQWVERVNKYVRLSSEGFSETTVIVNATFRRLQEFGIVEKISLNVVVNLQVLYLADGDWSLIS